MVRQKDENEFPDPVSPGRLDSLKNDDPEKCPPPGLLTRFHGGELTGKARRKIEDHFVLCPLCLKALEALRNAEDPGAEKAIPPGKWRLIEKSLNQKFNDRMREFSAAPPARRTAPDEAEPAGSTFKTLTARLKDFFPARRMAIAGSFAVLLIAGLYAFAYFGRDRYFSLARVEPEKTLSLRSGPADSVFEEGLELYTRGKYGKAVVRFESCVKADPDQYSPRYYLALSRLAGAEVRIMGLGCRYDGLEVEKAIGDLRKALPLAGDNDLYRADCLWHLGKACLMRGETERAKEHFSGILRLRRYNLPRRAEAEKMLSGLQEMERGSGPVK
jgi:tetratricopeptide (TPR) repeat protein